MGGGPSLDGVMDGDGSIDAEDENKVVCALGGRVDDVGVSPPETFDMLRGGAIRGNDVGAVLKPSFVYVVPYIGVMPR